MDRLDLDLPGAIAWMDRDGGILTTAMLKDLDRRLGLSEKAKARWIIPLGRLSGDAPDA